MSLTNTNLFIQMAQLPPTFKGTPQDLSVEMIKRMRIVSPNGVNFIFIGDVEPTSNVGPWLKGGTQWWVWDDQTNRYVPQDLSASFTAPFAVGNSTPSATNPPVWLKTTQDATDLAPTNFGEPIGWYLFDGTSWNPFIGITFSGPTANRPSNPVSFQLYYDTDISVLIWWERGAWRTVDGVVGDVKFVSSGTLTGALTTNPGWAVFATGLGLGVVAATQDSGSSPVTVQTPGAGVNAQTALAVSGPGPQGLQVSVTSTLIYTPQIALWQLVKL